MATERIDPRAHIGAVHLTVSSLPASIAFYAERLGFRVAGNESNVARLGAGGADLLVLHEDRAAPRPHRTTGLFHFAVLMPSRAALADALARLAATGTPLGGAADHGVSEALYLADPEGNGIELYCDRPRSEWPLENGQVQFVNREIDLDRLLAGRPGGAPAPPTLEPGTTIGHIHLRVSNLDECERFYVGLMGFDRIARLGHSALFVSAGGYHHHVGLNTWGGVGAPAPPEGALGLRHFVVQLSDTEQCRRVAERVRAGGVPIREEGGTIRFADPSENRIALAVSVEPARV